MLLKYYICMQFSNYSYLPQILMVLKHCMCMQFSNYSYESVSDSGVCQTLYVQCGNCISVSLSQIQVLLDKVREARAVLTSRLSSRGFSTQQQTSVQRPPPLPATPTTTSTVSAALTGKKWVLVTYCWLCMTVSACMHYVQLRVHNE